MYDELEERKLSLQISYWRNLKEGNYLDFFLLFYIVIHVSEFMFLIKCDIIMYKFKRKNESEKSKYPMVLTFAMLSFSS